MTSRAFYQKLNGVEPEVAAVLVRDSVRQLEPVIRHHAGMPMEKVGRRKLIGESDTGRVFEQKARIIDPQSGRPLTLRCVTVKLKTATRDGERELRILTNVPKKGADALKVANLYRRRWSVETMFQEMTENLTCEIKTPGSRRRGCSVPLPAVAAGRQRPARRVIQNICQPVPY